MIRSSSLTLDVITQPRTNTWHRSMKQIFLTLLLVVCPAGLATPASAAGMPEQEVDRIFSEFDRPDSPGCVLAVIRDGEFVYRRGYGMANLEYDIPLSADSVLRIGSTSKQFTAMAVALLANTGAISLDDPIGKYFPEFPQWADTVTVRQLILHTSGIRDYLQLAWLAGKSNEADYFTDDWVIELLSQQQETNFPPGSQYLYSNSGYLLLAHLVKRVTGKGLKEYSEEHIFKPLGMHNSHFHDDHNHIVPLRASGYAPTDKGYRISMTTLDLVGDGSVYTSVNDLLLWDRNFYENRLGSGGPALIEQVTTPGTLNNGDHLEYAFGLTVENYRGLPMISHGGAFVGFRAEMIRFPDQEMSVAVLCNRSDGAPTQKALRVAEFYLADQMQAVTDDRPETSSPAIAPGESELRIYAGDFWEHTRGFAAETRLEDGKLWAVHSPERRNELEPLGSHRFRMLGADAETMVVYEMGDAGVKKVLLTVNGTLQAEFEPFTRRQASGEELAAYAGNYYSDELRTWYQLYLEDEQLLFRIPGQSPQLLTAMFGETFENPEFGSFTFQRSKDGSIERFLLQSGRVRNLAFRRVP